MPTLRAQCIFPHASSMPEDNMTHTLHFISNAVGEWRGDADTLTPLLTAFFNSINSVAPIRDDFVPEDAIVKWYSLAEAPKRVPYTLDLGLDGGAGATTTIPSEVCVVLSFEGARTSGTNPARRRGRLFIGGRGNLVAANTSTNPPRVAQTTQIGIRNAAGTLRAAGVSANLPWAIWSPTNGTAVPVVSGWVDDELDTQRRRGHRAATRMTFQA